VDVHIEVKREGSVFSHNNLKGKDAKKLRPK
jgi:hypothetical protein